MDWFQPGHVAIVTGGSRGLGKALAGELLEKGLAVVIDGRDALELGRTRAAAMSACACSGSATSPAMANASPCSASSARGLGRLDLLVNNASTLGATPLPAIADLDRATFDALFAVNVFAPIHLVQHALKLMAGSDVATIVNVTSDAGVEAYPNWGGYGATKAALEHLSRVLAAELEGSTTRVLVFDPGDMDTAMHRAAVPDADPAELRAPADSARSLLRAVAGMTSGFERVRASDPIAA